MAETLTPELVFGPWTSGIGTDNGVQRRLVWPSSTVPSFDPLTVSPVAWYDPSDLSSMFQDSAGTTPAVVDQPVGKINDKSGNGNHLVQATTASKPVLRSSGGLYWLEFDGVDDFLPAAFALNQPCEMVAAFRTITWVHNTVLVFGSASAGLLNYGVTPEQILFAGTTAPVNNGQVVGTNHVSTFSLNGASSSLQINNGVAATGNPGTNNPAGITLGATSAGTAASNIAFFGLVVRGSVFTAPERASLKTHMGTKAGLVL